ncbi:Chemotaxis response regulator protein-glutamate methylesterase [Anatilimnocola aggregata]|uniref:Protein-glutamate methylesterase/protein-glutamine glutaminase n=1 Tax=Anatilimnocola aggregata TaxID=2528021 RepID=A0A517YFA4_9BACT|nr:chemotaxis-specific protein-glutamate methyltransferase CheB [Anatilimnocola aggregata]QDU28918.1 Chemotaxis response regulator protein-glutamate methylesterase [Anatilimnocola aggregata]
MSQVSSPTSPRSHIIRVLIVDDSAFVRKFVRQMLSRSPFIEVVGAARDGLEALELVEQLKPDVVTLDLNMPSADGLTFLRAQMERAPLPVIVVSMASKDGQQVLEALEAGAIDVIQKPTGLATERLLEITEELLAKVKAAAATHLLKRPAVEAGAPLVPLASRITNRQVDVVVLGVSTGGPQALKYLIPRLPKTFPVPIAMVLHMPVGYTELFARSLRDVSELDVREAREGDILRAGQVLLAPAGFHLSLLRKPTGEVASHLDLLPIDTAHRPAVDVLFKSAADVYGERTLGIVMTGMGSDGTPGSAWIKAAGGRIIVESEESCVVYGMPRSVVEAGLFDRSVPLAKMAATILEML